MCDGPAHDAGKQEPIRLCHRVLSAIDRLLGRPYRVAVNEKRRLIFLFSLKTIAAIEEPTVIERILTHLGLSAQPPPRMPARRTVSGRLIVEFGAVLPSADG